MKRVLVLCVLVVLGSALFAPAAESWKGSISDKMCGAVHMAKDAAKCTLECVKAGDPYVFVIGKDKILDIENQKDAKIAAELAKHAGHEVTVTGTMSKDGKSVKIETIVMK